MFEGHFVMVLPWFRLFAIQGENVHSVQKQIENISEHKSKEWLPDSTLCTHYWVPKALVLFVLALFLQLHLVGLGGKNTTTTHKTRAENGGRGNGYPTRMLHPSRAWCSKNSIVGKAVWGGLPRFPGGLCWVCVRKCLTVCGKGNPVLISIPSKLPTQWVMKNGICTKWRE